MPVTATISPTQSDIQKALGLFLMDVTGLSTAAIVAAIPNKVAEPKFPNFIVMTLLRFERISTSVDGYEDVKFLGTVASQVLTVSQMIAGTIESGDPLSGTGVPFGTIIVSQIDGVSGGVGTYNINSEIAISQQAVLSAGTKSITMSSVAVVQLDFHSDGYASSGFAQTVSATFRDPYGVEFFAGLDAPLNTIGPLYADQPAMRPFVNAEKNYEWRWVLEARLQVNQTVSVPQQFFDSITVQLIDVDAVYPPDFPGGSFSLDFSNPDNSQYIPSPG